MAFSRQIETLSQCTFHDLLSHIFSFRAMQGHAIECRINAEDPFKNFRPGPGRVKEYLPPGGPHVRMDSHMYPTYLVPPHYDSLLGKLVVWAETREQVEFMAGHCWRSASECCIGNS